MPRKYAKKRFVKKASTKRRRLNSNDDRSGSKRTARPTATQRMQDFFDQTNVKKNLRGRNPYANLKKRQTGRVGRAVVDASSGAVHGFTAGKKKRMTSVLQSRQSRVLKVLANTQYPVIKNHLHGLTEQLDWVAGEQNVAMYQCGYTTDEIQNMLIQSNSANSTLTSSLVAPAITDLLTNQRMDYYTKTTKFNFKNTCTHTCYLEIRLYHCKGYHSFNVLESWTAALLNDNMLQTPGTFGIEETVRSIGKRPDMKYPELNVRWTHDSAGLFKIALEPGQETQYTYHQPGGRFDAMRFNVAQGSNSTAVDVDGGPFTSQLLVFCRAELVTDAIDTDVTYGSGHIATNKEEWKSWAAVPYLKPRQESSQYQWGTIETALNEEDINKGDVLVDPYIERV